jgi:hypothetical protein
MTKNFIVAMTIILLSIATLTMAVFTFTSYGVPMRYERTVPADFSAMQAIRENLTIELEGYTSNSIHGGLDSGGSTEDGDRRELQWVGNRTFEPKEPSKARPTKTLLTIFQTLEKEAAKAGFVAFGHSLQCHEFGEEGSFGPAVTWDAQYRGANIRNFKFSFSGKKRFLHASVEYVSPQNLATRFRWDVLCDRKLATFHVSMYYFILSPVYTGPQTPEIGQRLQLTESIAK